MVVTPGPLKGEWRCYCIVEIRNKKHQKSPPLGGDLEGVKCSIL
jgi:hypothetical protein